MKLDNFVGMMTGHFDNKDQFKKMQAEGKTYPYAEHVNTICNDKINNLPEDFKGKFVVEESYYKINGKRHASPHLFLITEIEQGILLSSYVSILLKNPVKSRLFSSQNLYFSYKFPYIRIKFV